MIFAVPSTATFTSRLRAGVAWFLASEGVGIWNDDPRIPYTRDDVALTLKKLPPQPDNAIAVEVYDQEDDIVLPGSTIYVQLMFRAAAGGQRGDVDNIADAAFDALHGRHRFNAGSVRVARAYRISSAPLGADDNGREERSDNYALTVMR